MGDLNAHIIFHLPKNSGRISSISSGGCLVAAGGQYEDGVLFTQRVRHSKPGSDSADYLLHGIGNLLRYCLKGIAPDAAAEFGIQYKPQGLILGKRNRLLPIAGCGPCPLRASRRKRPARFGSGQRGEPQSQQGLAVRAARGSGNGQSVHAAYV